jgi:ankyrin repeat protein
MGEGDEDIVKALLEYGADVDARNQVRVRLETANL